MKLKESKFYILIGQTGVGKTTAIENFKQLNQNFYELPGRRELTSKYMIPLVQGILQEKLELISDRAERFRLTAEYRRLHSGGMAELLSTLDFDLPSDQIILFDGLRGENELEFAIENLQLAQFIVLDASYGVRLRRLSSRADNFDQVDILDGKVDLSELDGISDFLSENEIVIFEQKISSGEIAKTDFLKAFEIIKNESDNYNPKATIEMLRSQAHDRMIVIDTEQNTPEEVANLIQNFVS